MDDAWLSSLALNATAQRSDHSPHRRNNSLLGPADASLVQGTQWNLPNEHRQSSPAPILNSHTVVHASQKKSQELPQAELLVRAKSWHFLSDADQSTAGRQKRKSLDLHALLLEEQALEDELKDIESEILESSHQDYSSLFDELQLSQNHLDALVQRTNASLGILSSLSSSFRLVEEQANAFHQQCQSILAEQKRMTQLADGIQENVLYYTYLEPITRRLNTSGPSNIVSRADFPEMLSNLDSCLDYMQGHPKQHEAAVYQARYRLLLTRALTLIRVHFTDTLRALAADVSKRIADKQLNDTTQSALLYAKFRATAPELRDLGLEILKRAVPPADAENEGEAEYQSLLNELYQSYSATRGRLVLPLVVKKMAEISSVDNSVPDLISFARSAVGYFRGVCLDEYELWFEWFMVDGALYDFLEAICEPLFDYLRPRIIHETKLSKLCELCTFLQTTYVENDDTEDDDSSTPGHINGAQHHRLDLPALIQPALADAQTRLVFLAMSSLRDDIEYYKPKVEDLNYPKVDRRGSTQANGKQPVLSGKKGSTNSESQTQMPRPPTVVDQDDGENEYWSSEVDSNGEWYPTLPKAVRLLSRIYRLVNSTVFDDLAHRIVHSTTDSLVAASTQIGNKASPTDANLFLVSHLLRLKQQIVAFDIEFVAPEVSFDFSVLTDTFYELRDRGGLWNPGTWYKLASGGLLPRVVENMLDAKAELDGRLRVVINELVNSFATRITAPLTEVTSTPNSKQPQPLDPKRAATAVRGLAEKDVPFLRQKLGQYIDDVRTRETLVAAVRDQVVLVYEDWVDSLQVGSNVTKSIAGKANKKGKGREDELWSSDVFADWCETTFGRGGGDAGDHDEVSGLEYGAEEEGGSASA